MKIILRHCEKDSARPFSDEAISFYAIMEAYET